MRSSGGVERWRRWTEGGGGWSRGWRLHAFGLVFGPRQYGVAVRWSAADPGLYLTLTLARAIVLALSFVARERETVGGERVSERRAGNPSVPVVIINQSPPPSLSPPPPPPPTPSTAPRVIGLGRSLSGALARSYLMMVMVVVVRGGAWWCVVVVVVVVVYRKWLQYRWCCW